MKYSQTRTFGRICKWDFERTAHAAAQIPLTLLIVILLLFLVACEDNSVQPGTPGTTARITGQVVYDGLGTPAEDATVYLFENAALFGFVDSVLTDKDGEYKFTNLSVGPEYFLYARKYISPGSPVCIYVSPLSDSIRFFLGPGSIEMDDLVLVQIRASATVSGQVVFEANGLPADSADVFLNLFNGPEIRVAAGTLTDTGGHYSFTNVKTGNYIVSASKLLLSPTMLVGDSEHFFCDGVSTYTIEQLELGAIPVRKPAIYIYPEEDGYFDVRLAFNNGTYLTKSVPEYGSGWNVFVDRSGRIEQRYDYLFYEAGLGFLPGLCEGWCVCREDLPADLRHLLISIGLNEAETNDFIVYWRGVLTGYSYYNIYPMFDAGIDQFVELEVVPRPEAMLRVWLFFEGCDHFEPLPEPLLPVFQRGATTVIEWGGVLLN